MSRATVVLGLLMLLAAGVCRADSRFPTDVEPEMHIIYDVADRIDLYGPHEEWRAILYLRAARFHKGILLYDRNGRERTMAYLDGWSTKFHPVIDPIKDGMLDVLQDPRRVILIPPEE